MDDPLDEIEDLREGIDSFIDRWTKIQRASVKSIQALTNTLVQIEHLDGPLGKLEGFQKIRDNTKGKLLVTLFDQLVPALESSIKEFTKLMKMFENLRSKAARVQTFVESLRGNTEPITSWLGDADPSSIKKLLHSRYGRSRTGQSQYDSGDSERPLIEDIIGYLEVILMSIQEILNMFEAEFLVKITIFKDLEEGGVDIGVVSNYLTVWTAQPNIIPRTLEDLRKDLDEHLDLLRDALMSKGDFGILDVTKKLLPS
ncbi:MAG: hypothetical protein K9W43_06645 [Candidatus Thorarchaeota archaeon]|nr:hypothetical protein [Candidatus Thorarchaeota archaeon]